MKTVIQLENLINENKKEIVVYKHSLHRLKNRRISVLLKENERLKFLVSYLNTKPNEDFIKSEIKRLENSIRNLQSGYEYWLKHLKPYKVPLKKAKTFFNKEVGIPKLKEQLKTLKYLID